MPVHCLDFESFDNFSDGGHFIVKVSFFKLEESFSHFLLFSVLHVNVDKEQTEGNRADGDDDQSDGEIASDFLNGIGPLLITLCKPVDPGLHDIVEVVLDFFLVLSLTSCVWGH